MYKLLTVLLLILLSFPDSLAQPASVSSLQEKLAKATAPEEKIKILHDLTRTTASQDPAAAMAYGKQALKLAMRTQNKQLLANSFHNLGAVYQLQSNYEQATQYNFKALRIREEIGDSSGISVSYNNIGNLNNYLKAYKKARTYYQKALDVATSINDTLAISRALNNLGYSYEMENDIETSLQYYMRGLALKERIGDKEGITVSVLNIGDLHYRAGRLAQSELYLQRGLKLALETGHQINLCYAYRSLAEVYSKGGELEKAEEYALTSLELSRKLNSFYEIINSADVLDDIYQQAGDFAKAHHYLALSAAYQDSSQNELSRQQLEELQVKYDTEKKQKENMMLANAHARNMLALTNQKKITYLVSALLLTFAALALIFYRGKMHTRRLNRQLAQKNEEIMTSSKELQAQQEQLEKTNQIKNKLFSIMAHDLRGPLTSLSGMITLLRKGLVPEEQKDHYLSLVEANQQNSLWLLENLFLWAKTQMNGTTADLSHVQLQKLATENIRLLQPQADKKGIILQHQVEPSLAVLADIEMIKLVLRNLLSNAIKFCRAGDSITISAEAQERQAVVTVTDTGIGISPENQLRLFDNSNYSSRGTAKEKGSGLGLQLCQDFIQQHGGELWVESELGKGSSFSFTLPLAASNTDLASAAEKPENRNYDTVQWDLPKT